MCSSARCWAGSCAGGGGRERAPAGALFGALHALNALVVAGLATQIFVSARSYGASPAAVAARTPASAA